MDTAEQELKAQVDAMEATVGSLSVHVGNIQKDVDFIKGGLPTNASLSPGQVETLKGHLGGLSGKLEAVKNALAALDAENDGSDQVGTGTELGTDQA